MDALGERGTARQGVRLVEAGDLLQEGAGLVDETVVLTETDAGGVHRQTAGDVRVVGSDDHAPVAVGAGGTALVQHQLELGRTLLRPGGRALVPEHLQLESVRMTGGDPGHLDDAGAVGERGTERGVVVVLHRLVGVADLDLAVPDDRPQGHRTLGDGGGEPTAAHLGDVPGQELGQVRGVAADVGQGAGAGSALVAPGHRTLRVGGVVAPVARVEVQDVAEGAVLHQVAQRSDTGGPAVGEADAGHGAGGVGRLDHRAGVVEGVAERLLAEHVLAGRQQPLDHLPVQPVGHHDTHHVDAGVLRERLPGRVVALVTEASGRQLAQLGADVRDRDVPQRRQRRGVQRRSGPVGGGVSPTRHAGPDDSNTESHQ